MHHTPPASYHPEVGIAFPFSDGEQRFEHHRVVLQAAEWPPRPWASVPALPLCTTAPRGTASPVARLVLQTLNML